MERKKIETKHVLFIFIVQTILATLFSLVTIFLQNKELAVLLNYGFSQLALAIAVLFIVQMQRLDFFDAVPIKKRKINWLILALMPIIAVALLAQNTLLLSGFAVLMESLNIELNVPLPDLTKNAGVFIGAIILIGIVPPIVEEIYFRGVVLSAIKNRGMVYAVLVNATVFALAHMNVAQLVHQFIVGALLAYIVLKTDNIWYAIAIHMTNNIIGVLLILSKWYSSLADMSKTSIITMVIMMVVGFVVLVGCLVLFKRLSEKDAKKAAEEKKSKESDGQDLLKTEEKLSQIYGLDSGYKEVLYTGTNKEDPAEEDKIIDKALDNLKKKPSKLVDISILAICLFCTLIMIISMVVTSVVANMPIDFFE